MKNILRFTLISAFVITIYSCSDKFQLIGKWDDCIKLSTKNVVFKASPDSAIITTEGAGWWIIGLSINTEKFYDFRELNQELDNYSISFEGVMVERRDKHTLFIKTDENPNAAKRVINIGLEAGDYFDGIIITQQAK